MDTSHGTAQSDFLDKMRRQFDFGPYPRIPIDKTPRDDINELFVYNLVTPYYLRYQQVIDTQGTLILDAGCGTGYKALILAEANPGAKVVGIDISPKSVELAKQRLEHHGFENVEFHVLAIEDLPQLGLKFDYINCDEVLYFFDDIAQGLAALKAVLKPTGIIRANLHSALQRASFFRAQEMFNLMGLMEEDAEELAMPTVVEIMKALKPGVDLKQRTWNSKFEDEDNNSEGLLANHLLQGDKGYRIADLFDGLRRAELAFLSMLNWRRWQVRDLFQESDNLPTYVEMGLANCSIEEELTIYELLNPKYRLLDFWCGHPSASPGLMAVSDWSAEDWSRARVSLHPQLRVEKFKTAAADAIAERKPLVISTFLEISALNPVPVDSSVAALVLRLWEGPKPFSELVQLWQQLRPLDWVTMEPATIELASKEVIEILTSLEVFLYVLIEKGP